MKLKPQPRLPKRGTRAARPGRATRAGGGGRGRQARRPGVPLRRRVATRLPSIRRLLAGIGAVAVAAGLVALLAGPWLRVTDIAIAGQSYTAADDLDRLLAPARGKSVLAVDTDDLRARLESLPTVDSAAVTVTLAGRVEATIREPEPAFIWQTDAGSFIGAADGTIFAGGRDDASADAVATLPRIRDDRFLARLVTVGDMIPAPLLRIALRLAAVDPATFGSIAPTVAIRVDDDYGFRLVSADPAWEVALGVYGLDPEETPAQADARLDRQITAIRTLFAAHPEASLRWVDVRNPGKVYFRARG